MFAINNAIAKLLHQKHIAGVLDCLLDVALFFRSKACEFTGKDFARFGNETRKGFNIHERDVHRIA